ncbi:MAG: nucleotidyltransferase family protein [Chloroflexi bacterium]|nr:nucleotidyltransferase family protein [Chloroflexota bacterium]
MINNTTYRLLALCARAECNVTHYDQLARQVAQLTEWGGVPTQAESHGMAPLLYVHLKAAGVSLPSSVRRELQGLYLRHRHANQVRTRVLRDVLTAYDDAGIQVLIIKGAVLSHLVYPEPGLRPMGDLDILVPTSDLWRAQRLLAALGFDAPLPPNPTLPPRHLSAVKQTEGLVVHIEIHHRLLSNYFHDAVSYVRSRVSSARLARQKGRSSDLVFTSQPFALIDTTAYTLGYEESLQHLCRHLASHVNVWDFCRLIWVADVVSLTERFASEIDWKRVQRQYPVVLDMLSLFHFMTPLSDELLNRAGVKIGPSPQGIGIEYQGWPCPQEERRRSWRRILRDTLFPSEWWLRLRYKLGSHRPLFWYRWVRHPFYILGQAARATLEWLGWPTHSKLMDRRASK